MSVKIRREILPFAWVAVMGLTNVNADQDEMVRSSLMVDRSDILISGTKIKFKKAAH